MPHRKKGVTLSAEDLKLLENIVLRRQPSLLDSVSSLGKIALSDEKREEIRSVLADELCETGLQPDSEPNEYGLKMDDLIGALMYY